MFAKLLTSLCPSVAPQASPAENETKAGKNITYDEVYKALNAENKTKLFELLTSLDKIPTSSFNDTPLLHVAVAHRDCTAVALMLSKERDYSFLNGIHGGDTPLLHALRDDPHDENDIVQVLLHAGADVNAKGDGGMTALMLAVESSSMVKLLLESKAKVHEKNSEGRTALMLAYEKNGEKGKDCTDSIYALFAAGATSGLERHSDSQSGRWTIDDGGFVAIMNRAKGNVNAKNESGETTIMLSLAYGPAVLATIMKLGADINDVDEHGRTALTHAIMNKNEAAFCMLIENGALLDVQDKYGKTALIYAVENRCNDAFRRLIKADANIEIVDNHHKSALDHALELGQEYMASQLSKK